MSDPLLRPSEVRSTIGVLTNVLVSQNGTSKHAWDIPLSFMTPTMAKVQLAILCVVPLTKWASKAAILSLYIRIFGSINWLRRTCYFWIVFMLLVYCINVIVAGVYCIPRSGEIWGGPSSARCASNTWPHVLIGVFSLLADLFILILPLPIILRLRITRTRKTTLTVVFSTGVM